MMKTYVLILCLVVGLGEATTINDCPFPQDDYTKFYNGMCYQFNLHKYTEYWFGQHYCKQFGGNLVVFKDEPTKDFIHDTLLDYGQTSDIWIGISYNQDKKTFEWADGTPYNNLLIYDHKDCVAMSVHGDLVNHDCTFYYLSPTNANMKGKQLPYICQAKPKASANRPKSTKDPHTTTLPPTCPPFICTINCGMDGYRLDENNCSICQCDV